MYQTLHKFDHNVVLKVLTKCIDCVSRQMHRAELWPIIENLLLHPRLQKNFWSQEFFCEICSLFFFLSSYFSVSFLLSFFHSFFLYFLLLTYFYSSFFLTHFSKTYGLHDPLCGRQEKFRIFCSKLCNDIKTLTLSRLKF